MLAGALSQECRDSSRLQLARGVQHLRAVALAIGAQVAVLACGDGATTPAPALTEVRITPSLDTLFTSGSSVVLAATALDAVGAVITGKSFNWSSSNEAVATVTQAGTVEAAGPNGSATITAAVDGISANATIVVATGPQGGTVRESGGTIILQFPAGAVSQPISVTASAVAGYPDQKRVVSGTVFDLGPDGTAFGEPVLLTIQYAEGSVPSGSSESDLRLYRLVDGEWAEVPGGSVDVDANTASAAITSFSTYGVALPAGPGKVFANHDEWPFRSLGFALTPGAGTFAMNVANWFTGGTPGNFLAYSGDAALVGPELSATMIAAGHTWTVSTAVEFTLQNLLAYDAVFLSGTPADNTTLIAYVNAGGNVYLAGGTGVVPATEEAAQWNTFLNAFGLRMAPRFNFVEGLLQMCSSHPVFTNVGTLYFNRGSSVAEVDPANPDTDVLQVSDGNGLFAIHHKGGGRVRNLTSIQVTPPDPATLTAAGATLSLAATGIASAADQCSGELPDLTFEWNSSNPAAAGVGPDGVVTALSNGMANITATSGGVTSNGVQVTVDIPPVQFTPLISVDREQTCALLPDRTLWCWGENNNGVFGNGTETDSDNIPALAAGGVLFNAFSLGTHESDRACGLDVSGTAWCWGSGTGSTPQMLPGGLTFTTIAVGETHACALEPAGKAYCWGSNGSGELGDGTLTDRASPTPVAGNRTWVAIDAGDDYTCAIEAGGVAYCWGEGSSGQLGNGTTAVGANPDPVAVLGGLAFTQISAGVDRTCGVAAGSAYCWGNGPVGDGTEETRTQPTPVFGGGSARMVVSGSETVCLINTSDAASCWGENGDAALGDGTTNNALVPVAVSGNLQFRSIAPGESHSCGVTVQDQFFCWGARQSGTIGDGVPNGLGTPAAVSGGQAFDWVSAGDFTCGITTGSAAYCWGDGPLGNGTSTPNYVPALVSGGLSFTSISVALLGALPAIDSRSHACGVVTGGAAYCWGVNTFGALGDGTTTDRLGPALVSGGLTWKSVSAGYQGYSCGSTTANLAYCWGGSPAGFGNGMGSPTSSLVPIQAGSGGSFSDVSAGQQTCAVGTDDIGYCWGFDFTNVLSAPVESPFNTAPGVSFSAIRAGFNHSCGLSTTGNAYCWGTDFLGQLGDGSGAANPALVAGGLTFERVSVGEFHSCAVAAGGQGYCWGDNEFGQLGNGSVGAFADGPVQVTGGLLFRDISAGLRHTCGVTTGNVMYCWGYISHVGTGIAPLRLTPTVVVFP